MTTDTPNIAMLSGIVSNQLLNRLLSWDSLLQQSSYKRVSKQLGQELWETEETKQILEAIKPIGSYKTRPKKQ